MSAPHGIALTDADGFDRRFGGLRRLYGPVGAQRVFDAHVVVVGIGGVGSWAVEALARSGVGHLSLVDMDHVSESNTNRQLHALQSTLGQSKVEAMRDRILAINPNAKVELIDDFVTPQNWPGMASAWQVEGKSFALIDACDQMAAKVTMAAWALENSTLFITAGAAGGKRLGHLAEVKDLFHVTHDPLLSQLRYRLRKQHGVPRDDEINVMCVFSREAVAPPDASCVLPGDADGSLNCHGYGSSVAVTATFGFCAAGWVMDRLASGVSFLKKKKQRSKKPKNNAII